MTKAELVVKVTLAANGKLTRKRAEALVDAVFENLRTAIVEDGGAGGWMIEPCDDSVEIGRHVAFPVRQRIHFAGRAQGAAMPGVAHCAVEYSERSAPPVHGLDLAPGAAIQAST